MDARGRVAAGECPSVSLVFPTYNPGLLIDRTWSETRRFVQNADHAWEVLFVCDGCTDGTAERLRDLTHDEGSWVRIVTHEKNRGKGYSVRQGLLAARGKWRVFADVDLAYGFDDIQRLARTLQDGAEVVVASRSHPGSRMTMPVELQGYVYWRHIQSQVFSLLVRSFLQLGYDTQAGLKGMSAKVVERLVPHLQCDGFAFDLEFLQACVQQGFEILQIPVCVCHESRSSTTSIGSVARMIRDLWRVRRRRSHQIPPATATTTGVMPAAREYTDAA